MAKYHRKCVNWYFLRHFHYNIFSAQRAVFNVQFAVCSLQFVVCSVTCTVCRIPPNCTLQTVQQVQEVNSQQRGQVQIRLELDILAQLLQETSVHIDLEYLVQPQSQQLLNVCHRKLKKVFLFLFTKYYTKKVQSLVRSGPRV